MTRHFRGRPRIWVRLGCTGCSIPLLAALAAIVAAVMILTGCGAPAPASAPAPGTPAVNTLVCQHYLRQYAWKQNLAFPSMADAIKWLTYVTADGTEAVPGTKLARDLNQELLAMQGKKNTYKNGTVYKDCSA